MNTILVEWGELAAALFCFLLAHMLPARPAIRATIVAAIGRGPHLVLYSMLSVGLLMWIARAAARSPYVELWPYDDRLLVVPVVGMGLACALLVFGLGTPNPLSIGRATGFDPKKPGVVALVRHPVLWAALIWAASHLAVNGDLAHVVVFGAFAVLAIGGMLALDARARRRLGSAWPELAARTSNVPFAGYLRGTRPEVGRGTVVRLALSALLYAGLLLGHEFLVGVPVPL